MSFTEIIFGVVILLLLTHLAMVVYNYFTLNVVRNKVYDLERTSLISVFISVRNDQRYIRRCLNSLLSQNYNNYEIIIYNDHSSDESMSIVEEYTRNNSALKVIPTSTPPKDWLKENWYTYGSKFTANELVERICGGPMQVEPYIRYLKGKFGELYDLAG